MSKAVATLIVDRHMEDCSEEIKKAWRVIRNELSPKKFKLLKTS